MNQRAIRVLIVSVAIVVLLAAGYWSRAVFSPSKAPNCNELVAALKRQPSERLQGVSRWELLYLIGHLGEEGKCAIPELRALLKTADNEYEAASVAIALGKVGATEAAEDIRAFAGSIDPKSTAF